MRARSSPAWTTWADRLPGVPSQAPAELWQLTRASSWNSCSLPFCGLLNAVMAATPPACVRSQQPHLDSGPRWYSERNRLSVSWQLGF